MSKNLNKYGVGARSGMLIGLIFGLLTSGKGGQLFAWTMYGLLAGLLFDYVREHHPTDSGSPKRRWQQFSLGTLFAVAMIGCPLIASIVQQLKNAQFEADMARLESSIVRKEGGK
jgi:hypothetical protein